MSKKDDIDVLLGEGTKPAAKKTAAKPKAEAAAPAAKKSKAKAEEPAAPVKKAKTKAAEPEVVEKAKKEPISFAEGERAELADKVTAHFKRSKKSINSRDLAAKLETETRKLRVVLYSLVNKGVVTLEAGESKVAGMTVSPA